jgi:nucleotide-binding universal stress UspA family protein
MYRSILVPLDGTAFGEHALPAALALARRTGARLHLVHVHVPEGAWGALEAVPPLGAGARELVAERERAYLDGVLVRLARHLDAPVDAQVLEGPVARTLAEQARDAHVDLVVLGTHAHTGMSRLWHRGVAAYLTRHLDAPVVLVHAPEDAPAPALEAEPPLRHLLLPLGGADYAEAVLEHAAGLARAADARCTLLRVVAPPVEVGYTLLGQDGHVNHFQLDALREEALAYLEAVAARLRARGVEARCDVVASASAAVGIADYVTAAAGDPERRVDLVAMETHGLGGPAHLFAPGVVEQVVHDTTVPVLVHHAPRPEPEEVAESAVRHLGWPSDRRAHGFHHHVMMV